MNIVVTGASRGLGLALIETLIEQGHDVWGIARGEKPKELEGSANVRWTRCDITEGVAIDAWTRQMSSENFVPEIVILNAAVQIDDLGVTFEIKKAIQTIDITMNGTLRCIAALLPVFTSKGNGQFLVITSTAALRPSRRSAGYAASKAGLHMALRTLRLRYQSPAIRFREVCLGPMRTDLWEGKASFLVPSPASIAGSIASALTGNRDTLYYPFLSTFLLRITRWLPDRIFASLSHRFLT